MISDDFAIQLHDQLTRGVALSEQEQTQLTQWYAAQDGMENVTLSKNQDSQNIQALQTQVDTTIDHLLTITQKIQTLSAENETLRQDVRALKQQLTQFSIIRSA
ncbi:hypothetical protein [Phormidesmis sp. 146-33]